MNELRHLQAGRFRVRFATGMRHAVALVATLLATGCGESGATRIQLHSQLPPGKDPFRLEIQAQVTGPPASLRYKWFSISGECEPQETTAPATLFKFADNAFHDRVTVEAWRGEKRVGGAELDVKLDEGRVQLEAVPGVTVEITDVPPYDPFGGDVTRAHIGGMVRGKLAAGFKVVLYARVADTWYIQPMGNSAIPVGSDGAWTNWTHTGSSYAALVARPGFDPNVRLDLLPSVGGYIVARTVVDGAK